jgi:hypothetical protein
MKRNSSTVPHLCCAISEFDQRANAAIWVADYVPGQIGNLGGPKPGFCRQQNDNAISQWVTGRLGEQQEIVDLLFLQEAIEEMADLPALVGGYFFPQQRTFT